MEKQTIKFKRSKNSIKGLAFLKIIVISIMLVTSCSKDNYDNNYNTNVVNNGIEEIPITELQNDEVFKAIFSKKFNNKSFDSYLSSKNATTYKEKDEFYFPEKNAVIMKSDSLISYTMLIKRNDKKVNYFENLVIQINSKNQYSVNIVKYYPKKFQELKEHNSFSLESDKELVMISKDKKQTNKSNLINNQTCITITYNICNYSGKEHIAGPNCGSIFKTVSETVCFDTPPSGDSSNNGSGTWGWNYSDSITFPGSGGSYEDGDSGFTINTTPIDPRLDMGIDGSVTYTESYHAFFSQIFYNNLTDLKPWADENPDLYNLILSNIISNNWSVQSLNFANFTMRFLNDNPNVTWDQFENWFMGTPEGQDGEYDAAFWENPNLTFQQQNLPTYNDYVNNMARSSDGNLMKGADNIFGLVGGKVLDARKKDKANTENTCALKVSIALNRCNINIPNIPGQTIEGGGEFLGKYFFLNAKSLNSWMRKTFGTNNSNHIELLGNEGGMNGEKFPKSEKLKNIKGIYSMITTEEYDNSGGASGHADLLFKDSKGLANCAFGCFFNLPVKRIDVWILN